MDPKTEVRIARYATVRRKSPSPDLELGVVEEGSLRGEWHVTLIPCNYGFGKQPNLGGESYIVTERKKSALRITANH